MIRVLVADDQALVRGGFRLILDLQQDIEVVGEASDGREAIEMARQLRPGLIILDLSMPGMNGFEAARVLRRISPGVPLLMFTNFETPYVKQEAVAGVAVPWYRNRTLSNCSSTASTICSQLRPNLRYLSVEREMS